MGSFSRAAFILGQHPLGTGLFTIGMPGSPHGIPDWTPTIADIMKEQGYIAAQFGKNHFGDRYDALANSAMVENRPTPQTSKLLKDESLFQRGTQICLWAMPLLNTLGMKVGSEKMFAAGYNVLSVRGE